jgi:hypothetical protein
MGTQLWRGIGRKVASCQVPGLFDSGLFKCVVFKKRRVYERGVDERGEKKRGRLGYLCLSIAASCRFSRK